VEPEVYRTVNLVTVRGRPHGPAVGALVHVVKKHVWQDSPMPVRGSASSKF
jgi:LysR family transcriptional regulator, hydrogen peroxide-inducible genes activator